MNAPDRFADLRVNPDWAKLPLFDRSKWKRVRFGDVVRILKEEVDPQSGEVDRYVAGEHMDSESIHIRRWGNVGDGYLGPAFHRRFRKGQVLYGSRRTYLKKVAVAEWDGVTANTTLVLETVPDRMLQALLPWLMLSDRFTKHSIQESKGSTNPYINWPDIAKFEFELPPPQQQRKLSALFRELDTGLGMADLVVHREQALRQALVLDFVRKASVGWKALDDLLAEVQYGSSSKSQSTAAEGCKPIVGIPSVIGGVIDYSKVAWLPKEAQDEKYVLRKGDVLIVRTNGNPDYVGRTAVYEGDHYEECLYASYLIRLRTRADRLIAQYLHEMLQCSPIRTELRKHVRSSAGNYNLNTQGIRGLKIPAAPMKDQRLLLEQIRQIESPLKLSIAHASTIRSTRDAVLNML